MIEYSKFNQETQIMVDAIEDGNIVKVTEDYAKREGLLILRRYSSISTTPLSLKEKKEQTARENKGIIGMEDLRKPLRKESEILSELVDNFNWVLVQKRKIRGLTRKRLAEEIGENENHLKMLENGVLPMNNFILINKLENYYNISLRKNKIPIAPQRQLRQPVDFAARIARRREEQKREKEGFSNVDEIINVDSEDLSPNSQENKQEDQE